MVIVNNISYIPYSINVRNNNKKAENSSQQFMSTKCSTQVNPKLNLIYFTGRGTKLPFVEQLPKEIQKSRKGLIEDAIRFISSPEFYEDKIACKNWKNPYFVEEMTALINNPEALKWRADMLTLKTRSALQGNFADKNTIVIPWSGGRDSSSILANSFAFFPDKKFKLLTVINGMSENILNPAIQYKRILAKYDNPDKPINVEHYYIDTVDDIKKYVIDTALQDKEILGCPALCSSCKMVMEKSLGNVAKSYGSTDLVLGYSKYQGMQDWIEQTPEQIAFVTDELGKNGIRTSSPLYNVLEYPFDPILLLCSVGIPMNQQKIEMQCKAGGLNPKNLDKEKLLEFLIHKNEQTNDIFAKSIDILRLSEINEPKLISLLDEVKELRQNKDYRTGVFEEKKYNGQ